MPRKISDRKCSHPGCERGHAAKGYCSLHYGRFKSGLDMDMKPRYRAEIELCVFDGCARQARTRDYCTGHYQQLLSGRVMRPLGWRPEKHLIICSVETCDLPARGRRYCTGHQQRIKSGTPMLPPIAQRDRYWGMHCTITGCKRPYHASGLCKTHQRKTKYGLSAMQLDMIIRRGKCDSCGTPLGIDDFHIDHDHSCCVGPKVCGNCNRGALCRGCNHGIGNFKDSPNSLRLAADYLERYGLAA